MSSTAVTSRASRDTSARTAPSGPALRRATVNRFCRLWTSTSANGRLPRSRAVGRGPWGDWCRPWRGAPPTGYLAPSPSPVVLRPTPHGPRPTAHAPLAPRALVVAQADLPDEEPDR